MGSAESPRASRVPARLLALAQGCVLAFVLLELALRSLAGAVAPEVRASAPALTTRAGERRILCFGDSNTYGVYLPAHESYPAQLQQLLDRAPEQPWRVVNLGFPGTNSAEVRADFARRLDEFRPEIAIVWIGINDTWSLARADLWELADREAEAAGGFWNSLRVVKLARIARQRASGADTPTPADGATALPIDADGRLRFESPGPLPRSAFHAVADAEVRRRVQLDLGRMATLCAERGVKLALCNYPYEIQVATEVVNPAIAAAARDNGVLLVDLAGGLLPAYRHFGVEEMLFPDFHQRASGNREVARIVAAALCGAGWIESRDEWRALPSLVESEPHLRLVGRGLAGDLLALDAYGMPRWSIEFELRPLATRPEEREPSPLDGAVPVELALQPNGLPLALRAELDASGVARIELPLPPSALGVRWCAGAGASFEGWCLRALGRQDAASVPRSSNSLRLARASLRP